MVDDEGLGIYMFSMIKFNILSIPSGSTIDDATMWFYVSVVGDGWDDLPDDFAGNVTMYRVLNQTWTEDDAGAFLNNIYSNQVEEQTNLSGYGLTTGWDSLNVSDFVQSDYNAENSNASFVFESLLNIGQTRNTATNDVYLGIGTSYYAEGNYRYIRMHSKEYTTDTSLRPYLNITYTEIPEAKTSTDYFKTTINYDATVVSRLANIFRKPLQILNINLIVDKLSSFFRKLIDFFGINSVISKLSNFFKSISQSFSITSIVERVVGFFRAILIFFLP